MCRVLTSPNSWRMTTGCRDSAVPRQSTAVVFSSSIPSSSSWTMATPATGATRARIDSASTTHHPGEAPSHLERRHRQGARWTTSKRSFLPIFSDVRGDADHAFVRNGRVRGDRRIAACLDAIAADRNGAVQHRLAIGREREDHVAGADPADPVSDRCVPERPSGSSVACCLPVPERARRRRRRRSRGSESSSRHAPVAMVAVRSPRRPPSRHTCERRRPGRQDAFEVAPRCTARARGRCRGRDAAPGTRQRGERDRAPRRRAPMPPDRVRVATPLAVNAQRA